jgi:hypothetical protein
VELRLILHFVDNISNSLLIFIINKKHILPKENNFEINSANCVMMKIFKKNNTLNQRFNSFICEMP